MLSASILIAIVFPFVPAQNLEASQHEIESLRLYIGNLKIENKSLQDRISKLTENSLLGDQMETHRISQITSSHHSRISKVQFGLNESNRKLEQNQNQIKLLKEELSRATEQNDKLRNERDDLKKDVAVLKSENEKMKTKTRLFEDQSGINVKDLECALELIEKSKRTKDSNLDFLNATEIDKCDDPIILRGKIDELQISNRDLILECTQNQNLLETQITLNKKMERDYHELEEEYIELKGDNNNIKSEMYRLSQTRNLSNLLVSENELFVKSDIDNIHYGTTENLIIFKILYGELNPNCTYFKENNINPLTMIIVDFFEFESIYSNIYGGYNPKYNLFCQYKIRMDDFFLEHIENDFISIDFVQKVNQNKSQSKSKLNIISNSKVSLKNLLVTPDSCIQNEIEIISNDGDEQYVGKLSFIAKMLRSVDINYQKMKGQAQTDEDENIGRSPEMQETNQNEVEKESVQISTDSPQLCEQTFETQDKEEMDALEEELNNVDL